LACVKLLSDSSARSDGDDSDVRFFSRFSCDSQSSSSARSLSRRSLAALAALPSSRCFLAFFLSCTK
jgi:hypothetical protein